LFLLIDESDLYRKFHGIKKDNVVSIYFGKVEKRTILSKIRCLKPLLDKFEKIHIITRGYPENRSELFDLIASSRLFISFDPLTNTFYEATLLGTPAILMDNRYSILETDFNLPLWGLSTSIQDMEKIESEVGRAFDAYVTHIASQEQMVKNWAESVLSHFNKIFVDHEYLDTNRQLIERQSKKDFSRFESIMRKRSFLNIYYPINLSTKILRILRRIDYIKEKREYFTLRRALKRFLKRIGLFNPLHLLYMNTRRLLGTK
jgi:hypothetical protein